MQQQPHQQQPQQQVAFSRNPGTANPDLLLDYSQKEKTKIYKESTYSLYSSTSEEKFDMETERFPTFMTRLKVRGIEVCFIRHNDEEGSIFCIPDTIDANGVQHGPFVNMMNNYAEIDMEKVKAYEDYLRTANTRQSQNLDMLYQLLWNSMSEKAQTAIGFWEGRYVDQDDQTFRRGLSLLTTIIELKTISTVATVEQERLRLTQLVAFAEQVEGEIPAIHEEVNDAMKKLVAYNKPYSADDLLLTLWQTYEQVTCKQFREWLKLRRDAHDEGNATQTATSLMRIVQMKYETLVQSKEWNKESVNDVQMLLAQQAEMQKSMKSLKTKLKDAKKAASTKGQKNGKGGKEKSTTQRDKFRLTDEERFEHKRGRREPKWLEKQFNPNPNNEEATRWFNGNRYCWDQAISKWKKDKNAKVPKWYKGKKGGRKDKDKSAQFEKPPPKKHKVNVYDCVQEDPNGNASEDSDSDAAE